MDIAKMIGVKCAPLAVSAAKEAITKGADLPLEEGLGLELKRQPQFKGQ